MQHGQVLEEPQSNSLKLVTRQERSQCGKTDSQDSVQPGTPRCCLWPLPWTLTEGAGNNPDSLMLWGGATLCDGKLAGVQESFATAWAPNCSTTWLSPWLILESLTLPLLTCHCLNGSWVFEAPGDAWLIEILGLLTPNRPPPPAPVMIPIPQLGQSPYNSSSSLWLFYTLPSGPSPPSFHSWLWVFCLSIATLKLDLKFIF